MYEAQALRPGDTFSGPALVDSIDNTLWVPAGCTADVDRYDTVAVVGTD